VSRPKFEPDSSRIEDRSLTTGAILFSYETLRDLHSCNVTACNLYLDTSVPLEYISIIVRAKDEGKNVGLHVSATRNIIEDCNMEYVCFTRFGHVEYITHCYEKVKQVTFTL
jgi:hypothetical protein